MAERGRPTDYRPELADAICQRLAEGESLRSICRGEDMPPESTVRLWVVDDREGFAAQYARARDVALDCMADEVLEISDDGTNDWMARNGEGYQLNGEHVQRSRLRVDSRKWYLSKLAPKRYGDKMALEHGGVDGQPLAIQIVRFGEKDATETGEG